MIVKYDTAAFVSCNKLCLFLFCYKRILFYFYSVLKEKYIFTISWYIKYIFCTVAKHSKDATNNPPTLRPKLLLPLWSRNIISLCIDKGVIYH